MCDGVEQSFCSDRDRDLGTCEDINDSACEVTTWMFSKHHWVLSTMHPKSLDWARRNLRDLALDKTLAKDLKLSTTHPKA